MLNRTGHNHHHHHHFFPSYSELEAQYHLQGRRLVRPDGQRWWSRHVAVRTESLLATQVSMIEIFLLMLMLVLMPMMMSPMVMMLTSLQYGLATHDGNHHCIIKIFLLMLVLMLTRMLMMALMLVLMLMMVLNGLWPQSPLIVKVIPQNFTKFPSSHTLAANLQHSLDIYIVTLAFWQRETMKRSFAKSGETSNPLILWKFTSH